MKIGSRVKNIETNGEGWVIADSFGCCDESEELIVWDGTNTGFGTDRKLLKEIESPEIIAIPEKCGAGRESECCIFLTAGSSGFNCDRLTSLRDSLIFRTMSAKRNPTESYPECMKF